MVANIASHSGLDSREHVNVSLLLAKDRLTLEFSDTGIPFNPLTQADSAPLGLESEHADVGGLGVHLLQALSDQQHYQRLGNKNLLRLIKQL